MADIQERIATGLHYATPLRNKAEEDVACLLFEELSNSCSGRGLTLEGAGQNRDDGRWVVVVSGSIDLIALARRALGYLAPDLDEVIGKRD